MIIKNTNKRQVLEQSIEKAKVTEEIAKNEYRAGGFEIIETGYGSDFKATKILPDGTKIEELVEVKSGKGRLSKKQQALQRKCKREGKRYRLYRVNDRHLLNQLGKGNSNKLFKVFLGIVHESKFRIPSIKKCPRCKDVAAGLIEIVNKFGLRKVGRYIRSQSWCRICRFPFGGVIAA